MTATAPPTWWEYVQYHRGRDSNFLIARKTGLTSSTVSRWQTATPGVESVRAFATAYNRPILEAFIWAGFLAAEEAEVTVVEVEKELTDRQVTDLILTRFTRLRQLEEGLAPVAGGSR